MPTDGRSLAGQGLRRPGGPRGPWALHGAHRATAPSAPHCGGDLLDAMASRPGAAPCTGDWCLVHEPGRTARSPSRRLAARRTRLVRADASRSSHGQVLAANVDLVALVVGLHPEPNLGRIERLLAIAWESGADPSSC